ncbi:putative short-chain dehydrogenase/reductase [Aspergillus stella-maris]|uniref:putative short-chain dehydrogenase/reductase n=1 Tax=Aspergillus stella-maris TaxID=1810926 RepID=UPI003CCDB15E
MSPAQPYAHLHTNPSGPGDARPTALQIIADESLTNALPGTNFVLTGASSGIGLETARALLATGATLYLPVRNLESAKTALSTLLPSSHDKAHINLIEMDISCLASVKRAATEILSRSSGKINTLIANAGMMGLPELTLSEDGYEMHFATNYLGHLYLFHLLKDALLSSASPEKSSRVVVVSSSAARAAKLNADGEEGYDYNFRGASSTYDMQAAYGRAKLAAIYMANTIERRYGARNLHATSLHPGGIDTAISRHVGKGFVDILMSNPAIARIVKSPEQGAATTVWAAVAAEWEKRGGWYLEDCGEAGEGVDDGDVFGVGFVKRMYDVDAEERVWEAMCRLVGVAEE